MTGIILVDKQQDWTSSDVVAKLRGVLHEKRIGHAGTLDPLATGLLIVMVGRATRASDYIMEHTKEYVAHFRAGVKTDTQDITGSVLGEKKCCVSTSELEKVLCDYKGDLLQIPPMYSAIKIKGKKLYEIARKGGEVERKPRKIHVDDIEVCGMAENDYILRIRCSAGTYIRTLCNDIGDSLGCGGCMAALRRTKIGGLNVEDAFTIDEISKFMQTGETDRFLIPLDRAFSAYDALIVDSENEKRLRQGNQVRNSAENGMYRVYSETGEFMLLGQVKNCILKTEKSFFEVK